MRQALRITQQAFGDNHPRVAGDLSNLAQIFVATNRLDEAEPLMRQALRITQQAFGDNHPDVAMHLNNLAMLLVATNRLDETEPLLRQALEILLAFGRATGHVHPNLETAVNNYGRLLLEVGRDRDEVAAILHAMAPEFFGA